MTTPGAGLEDVVAGQSAICDVDGKQGRLIYYGYDIRDLAAHSTFVETAYLLWHGRLPTQRQLQATEEALRAARALPPPVLELITFFPRSARPMEALRTAVSALAMYDPDARDMSREANERKALRLTAQIPSIVAAFHRARQGLAPLAPDPALDHAANLLYMLSGQRPDPESARVFDVALILHADHELNASTFAARVTAATLADIHAAITSAIGALEGPLHGGANERVMAMLLEIGAPERAHDWVRDALARKQRIMGFGHRVYRTYDPRAVVLRELARQVGERAGQPQWFEIAQVVEREVMAQKGLYPNVDFYSGPTYYALGIPPDLFTPIFACSRIAGWTAHVLEQYANNRLIRPRAEYIGPRDLQYLPIEQRSEAVGAGIAG